MPQIKIHVAKALPKESKAPAGRGSARDHPGGLGS